MLTRLDTQHKLFLTIASVVIGLIFIGYIRTPEGPARLGIQHPSGLVAMKTAEEIFIPETAEEMVTLFLQTIRQGRYAEAYQQYCSPLFREATKFEAFKNEMKRYPTLSRNRDMTTLEVFYYAKHGTVSMLLQATDNSDNWVEFDVVYEVRDWRILGIQVHSTPRELRYLLED